MANDIVLQKSSNSTAGVYEAWSGCGFSYELCSDLSLFFESPKCFFRFLIHQNGPCQIAIEMETGKASLISPSDPSKCLLTVKTFWSDIDSLEDSLEETVNLVDLVKETERYCSWLSEVIQNQKEKSVITDCKVSPRKSYQQKEQLFELKLEAFLQVNQIQVERQVIAANKRLDLWIPGQLMIECKAGRVTGDDVCQAIDYLATFERDVLLVGTGLSPAASRGIESINKISSEVKLLFVTQEACFGYLKAVCK
jgi:hypothetical protein